MTCPLCGHRRCQCPKPVAPEPDIPTEANEGGAPVSDEESERVMTAESDRSPVTEAPSGSRAQAWAEEYRTAEQMIAELRASLEKNRPRFLINGAPIATVEPDGRIRLSDVSLDAETMRKFIEWASAVVG